MHCVQDGAPELRILPQTFRAALPPEANVLELVDFDHLVGYLDDIVDACEPAGDPSDMKGWYRSELLSDDGAIDRIWRNLHRKAKTLPRDDAPAQRKAVAAALSYIRKRKRSSRPSTCFPTPSTSKRSRSSIAARAESAPKPRAAPRDQNAMAAMRSHDQYAARIPMAYRAGWRAPPSHFCGMGARTSR